MNTFVTAVIPMHNERDNAGSTLQALARAFVEQGWDYELVPVNDGSTDGTGEELQRLAAADARIRPVSYAKNRGRGYALRQGFAAARGRYVTSLDADLSFSPGEAVRMVAMLDQHPEIDVVIASFHMPGGCVENVPPLRLAISRVGNVMLRRAQRQRFYTSTGVGRAYRREALKSLPLYSDDKEIHLEILAAALALGYRIVEMPATLGARQKGHSKFRPGRTIRSHLAFLFTQRATTILATSSFVMLGLAVVAALLGRLETVAVASLAVGAWSLALSGAIGLGLTLVSMQAAELRKGTIRIQSELKLAATDRPDAPASRVTAHPEGVRTEGAREQDSLGK